MKRKMTELLPHEILHVAITIEERNAGIYEEYAAIFRGYDEEASRIFSEMAEEERQHKAELEEGYRARFGEKRCDLTEKDIQESVEAPFLEESEVLIFDAMSGKKAFEVALKTEEQARLFYEELARFESDEDLRALYHELAGFEVTHVEQVRKKLNEYATKEGSKQE